MDEQMRERFEVWALSPEIQLDVRREELQPAPYIDYTTAWAWSAWQAALSQPAARGDSSHSAGGECGGVQVPAASKHPFERPLDDDICKTCGKDYGSHYNVICPVGRGTWEPTL